MKEAALEQRFWSKVQRTPDGCWNWIASTKRVQHGGQKMFDYGQVSVNGRPSSAHRVAWTLVNGHIPPELFVCHKCDNPRCVRPSHLFIGTAKDNAQDMLAKGRNAYISLPKDACRNGHSRDSTNVFYRVRRGKTVRECKICDAAARHRRRETNKDQINAQRRAQYKKKGRRCNAITGVRGVMPDHGGYRAQLNHVYVGVFPTIGEAVAALNAIRSGAATLTAFRKRNTRD